MAGTSDIGMMYRQELARRGVPLTADNMRRLVSESRANPDLQALISSYGGTTTVPGLRVQGEDTTQSAPSRVAASSQPPLPTPPRPPDMVLGGSSGVIEAGPPPSSVASMVNGGASATTPAGVPAPAANSSVGSGSPAGAPGPAPASVASAVNAGTPVVLGGPSGDVEGIGGQGNLPDLPSGDPSGVGGQQSAPVYKNDAQRLGALLSGRMPSAPDYADPDAPPLGAPGTGPGTGGVVTPSTDRDGVAAAILASLGLGGAALGMRQAQPRAAAQRPTVGAGDVIAKPPTDIPTPVQRGPLTGRTPQDDVLNRMRQTSFIDPDNAGLSEVTVPGARAKTVPIVPGPPGTRVGESQGVAPKPAYTAESHDPLVPQQTLPAMINSGTRLPPPGASAGPPPASGVRTGPDGTPLPLQGPSVGQRPVQGPPESLVVPHNAEGHDPFTNPPRYTAEGQDPLIAARTPPKPVPKIRGGRTKVTLPRLIP